MPAYSKLKRGLAHYWSLDNSGYPAWQWDRMRTSDLSISGVRPTTGWTQEGKIGLGVNVATSWFGCALPAPATLFSSSPPALTISMWFRMDDASASDVPLSSSFLPPTGGYSLQYLAATSVFRLSVTPATPPPLPAPTVTADVSYTATDGEWFHALMFIDSVHERIGLKINNGTTTWTVNPDVDSVPLGYQLRLGQGFAGVIDDTAMWGRILTDNECELLWNGGLGVGYEDWTDDEAETSCKEIPCCDTDPYTYVAKTATSSGATTGSDCATVPFVTISPPSSSYVSFPTFILLESSESGSVIRYTIDGTDPTEDSTVYTIPFEIYGPAILVKAKAWLGDCPGPVAAAMYNREPTGLTFQNLCSPPLYDQAGGWGVFAADGLPDYAWQLDFTAPGGGQHIVALEIYETNSIGNWNTGQAWATREYVAPPSGTTSTHFHVYPLVLIEVGQINAAYSDDFCTDFGDFAAGAHTVYLYGQIQVDVPGVTYFRLRIFQEDGTIIERIIASDVCTPPPCELFPPPPTIAEHCGYLTVSWATIAGMPYQLWRWDEITNTETIITTGTTTAADSYDDYGVSEGVEYCYHLRVQYNDGVTYFCPTYTTGHDGCGRPSLLPYLSVTPSATVIESATGGVVNFTVTSGNILSGGACLSNTVDYTLSDGSPGGSIAANGTTVQPLALTCPAVAPYVVTVTFTACNECDTETVAIPITFTGPPCCTAVLSGLTVDTSALIPAVQSISNSSACGIQFSTVGVVGPAKVWNGELVVKLGASCEFEQPEADLCLCAYRYGSQDINLGYVNVTVLFSGGCLPGSYYAISINLIVGDTDIVIWGGTKNNGSSAAGTYTYTTGCASSVPTIVLT